jgi:hypothetical protein
MAKPGLQSTPDFILSQMISQRCLKLIYSQCICNRMMFSPLARYLQKWILITKRIVKFTQI